MRAFRGTISSRGSIRFPWAQRRIAVPILSAAATLVLLVAGLTLASPVAPAQAALSGSSFLPGYIIADAQFFDANAMTQPQIQSFLNSEVGSCTNTSCLSVLRGDSNSRAAYVNPTSGNTECNAYSGASSELASTIIFKVQQACGISARVLLVTLQKEQGLITSHGPSSGTLGRAMGYGCPDSANGACDQLYYGFFNQVYSAARQFKIYRAAPTHFNFSVGHTYNVLYNPNPKCLTRSVYMADAATAALYNYTPYTPNDDALANLSGTAYCGSYGNRNFWVYYSSWFGSPLGAGGLTNDFGDAAITARFNALGGTAATGAATGATTCNSTATACQRIYLNGIIFWSISTGAEFMVNGSILDAFIASGGQAGPLGDPVSIVYTYTANGGGTAQDFQNGASIFSSTSGTFAIAGQLRTAYFATGGSDGPLGWPTTAQTCGVGNSGCVQSFQHGSAYGDAQVGGTAYGVIGAAWLATGGASGPLGYPASPVYSYTANGGGTAEDFLNSASIYASAAGAFTVAGAIRANYFTTGGSDGPLGWPTGAPSCGLPNNGCSQPFQFGSIYSTSAGTGASYGAIASAWSASGGASGPLGYPTTVVFSYPDNGGGTAQDFQNAWSIYASPAGAFPVGGAIRANYFKAGGAVGALGWPTAAQVCGLPSIGCSQAFQHGTVFASSLTSGNVSGPIGTAFTSAGGPGGPLGYPTSIVYSYSQNGGGTAQDFQNGWSIYASPAGAFPVGGAIRTTYFKNGGSIGTLGWPTAAQTCTSGTTQCTQTFQNGTVSSAGIVGFAVNGAIATAYATAGGSTGPLGVATSIVYSYSQNGGGTAQDFQNGWSIYASPAGAFPVGGAIRTTYFKNGGSIGTLGWPTAAQTCTSGTTQCTQTFQHGTVTAG